MDKKKEEYEAEIGNILRKVMENSYQRKKNTENILSILKTIRQEEEPSSLNKALLNEYSTLKHRILVNLGIKKEEN